MSELPVSDVPLDLSRLPAPQFVEALSFEAVRAERLADLQQRLPDFSALVESDPGVKLAESGAYRELLLRGAVNDVGRSTLLAYAGGADLDQFGARYGVARLTMIPATDDAPAVLESDDDLRTRIQLAPERLAAGGMTPGGIRFRALTAAPSIRDIGLIKRGGGQIDVALLARDGVPSSDAIAEVRAALTGEDVIGLTDIVVVRAAAIVAYDVAVTLRVRPGPDPTMIRNQAEAAIRAYAAQRYRVGLPVFAHMLRAAAAVGGVDQVLSDIADIEPGPSAAAQLGALAVTTEVIR